MIRFIEQLIAFIWNRLRGRRRGARHDGGTLDLGFRVIDGAIGRARFSTSSTRRTMHMSVLGKTGSGKSRFLHNIARQDIEGDRGFCYFDFHGESVKFLLRTIRARELRDGRHLSDRLIIIDPTDPLVSVGFNPLEQLAEDFVRITEFSQILKQRWHLDHFGARTDELLRNSLWVLAANNLTIVELGLLLAQDGFRSACLKHVHNPEIRQYFELRYDQASDAMRATMREAILNKTSAFSADPHFRHILGQSRSTFSVREAMDQGYWIIVNLEKGKLGPQSATLGSLILSVIKNALFAREKRSLFTLYCDEFQNLVAYESGIEMILSEARKFGVSVSSANQFLDQYPAEMRSALLAVGTHVYFQLSSSDASQVAQTLDGGKPLAERLKNLPLRHAIVKSSSDQWAEIRIPNVEAADVDYTDLVNRSRFKWGRTRKQIEQDIAKRQTVARRSADEVLNGWQ
jgi:Helicase HerA, central domain